MFSKQITSSDAFIDMPVSSQLLYFHLNMEADDDGFVASPKRIIRMLNAGDDDLKILLAKRFLLAFENGVVVIKHWLLHNAVRKDMYKETQYLEEKKQLKIKENGSYTEVRNESVTSPLHRLDQVRLGKDRLEREVEQSSPTPSQTAKAFFQNPSIAKEWDLYDEQEIKKFVSYWTELNKSGTRQRWQLEKTFDVKRRLGTWYERASTFNKKDGKPGKTVIEVGSLKFYKVEDLKKAEKEGKIRWDTHEKKWLQIS